ncbi:hypothetical protein MNV49_007689 [Pseudohyphozyma bogoriensis]|nr:hypothetical protein MNV49_007689 [Pseudohyphozyma bogoriensis]
MSLQILDIADISRSLDLTHPALHLRFLEETYHVLRFSPSVTLPPPFISLLTSPTPPSSFVSYTRTPVETSIIIPSTLVKDFEHLLSSDSASAGTATLPENASEGPWAMFRVRGPMELHMTGVMARLTAPLKVAGVAIFASSTYDTDYVLVHEEDREKAKKALLGDALKFEDDDDDSTEPDDQSDDEYLGKANTLPTKRRGKAKGSSVPWQGEHPEDVVAACVAFLEKDPRPRTFRQLLDVARALPNKATHGDSQNFRHWIERKSAGKDKARCPILIDKSAQRRAWTGSGGGHGASGTKRARSDDGDDRQGSYRPRISEDVKPSISSGQSTSNLSSPPFDIVAWSLKQGDPPSLPHSTLPTANPSIGHRNFSQPAPLTSSRVHHPAFGNAPQPLPTAHTFDPTAPPSRFFSTPLPQPSPSPFFDSTPSACSTPSTLAPTHLKPQLHHVASFPQLAMATTPQYLPSPSPFLPTMHRFLQALNVPSLLVIAPKLIATGLDSVDSLVDLLVMDEGAMELLLKNLEKGEGEETGVPKITCKVFASALKRAREEIKAGPMPKEEGPVKKEEGSVEKEQVVEDISKRACEEGDEGRKWVD